MALVGVFPSHPLEAFKYFLEDRIVSSPSKDSCIFLKFKYYQLSTPLKLWIMNFISSWPIHHYPDRDEEWNWSGDFTSRSDLTEWLNRALYHRLSKIPWTWTMKIWLNIVKVIKFPKFLCNLWKRHYNNSMSKNKLSLHGRAILSVCSKILARYWQFFL